MNKTKELLVNIRRALREGKLPPAEVPIDAVKDAIYSELQVNKNTFFAKQHQQVLKHVEELCQDISDQETDIGRISLFLDGAILCIGMISKLAHSLANKAYWLYKHPEALGEPEVMEVIDHIDREGVIRLLNYDFVREYEQILVEVYLDENCGLSFIPYKRRRMYFPRNWDGNKIVEYYRATLSEQDRRSPHCYMEEGFFVEEGDVVVDVGTAEGIFALDVIDLASQVYLIEADMEWVEALQHTFANDAEKIVLVPKYLSNEDNDTYITLDSLFGNQKVNYIKMDIEGYEKPALLGASRVLEQGEDIKCAICSYHCKEDEAWIKAFLGQYGYETKCSRGYMSPDWTVESYLEAELRRGVVFGRK